MNKKGEIVGLLIADIHFGKTNDDKGLYKSLVKYFYPKINYFGKKHELDFVSIVGDLFDRIIKLNENGSIYAIKFINVLIEKALKYNFKIRILKGTKTHDFNQLDNFKELEKRYPNTFKIIETVQTEKLFDNFNVLYIPEEYIENPDEYYSKYFKKKYDLILFHGTMSFASYISNIESERAVKNAPTFNSKQIASIVYGKAIGGHIHIRQKYKNKIEYIGSFSRFCFGEEKPKGFLEYFYQPKTHNCRTIFIENEDAPKYVTFNINDIEADNLEEKMSIINKLKKEYDHVRIIANDIEQKDALTIKNLLNEDEKVKIEVKCNDLEDKIDKKYMFIINREYDIPTTIQKYISLQKGKEIDIKKIREIIKSEN